MDNSEKSILKTIIYSDIFDYPLTQKEIWLFLITASHVSQAFIEKKLRQIPVIEKVGIYYVLKGRAALVKLREKRLIASKQKMKKATEVARIAMSIPTVYCIGVSGGVAMQNANAQDDIDLFIITKKNTVWMTRLLLLFLLQLLGVRRKRGEISVMNKICLNMIIDESALQFPEKREDMYTAHEIVQLVPLRDRHNTYKLFLSKNKWVKSYLYSAYMQKRSYIRQTESYFSISFGAWILSLPGFEFLARGIQEIFIRKHQTSETIEKNILAFHPLDYRSATVKQYTKRIKAYGI